MSDPGNNLRLLDLKSLEPYLMALEEGACIGENLPSVLLDDPIGRVVDLDILEAGSIESEKNLYAFLA